MTVSIATDTPNASDSGARSIITCDLEGRIETFSKGASEVFGYAPEEVIGRKRVSLFSPGLTVLEHVPTWLKLAVRDGSHETETVFVRKDGSRFPAKIRITPTFRKGRQIGYCGITTPLPPERIAEAAPRISPFTRIFAALVITRAPFLTAALVPVLIGAAFAASRGLSPFPWPAFALALAGALALHVSANTFNDYFDWKSGADLENNDYFLPFSGGSRSIELGLITEQGLWRLSWAALALSAACGLGIIALQGSIGILAFGLLGAFAAYFYTAPPLRLVARRGLGELWVGLCFGPLMTGGTFTALTGSFDVTSLAVGIPAGLLTTAILWINQFPDARSDAKTGKNHLVVTLGKSAARWGYLALLAGAFANLTALVATGLLPSRALWALGSLPFALHAGWVLVRQYEQRRLIAGNRSTILLQLAFGLLMFAGLL